MYRVKLLCVCRRQLQIILKAVYGFMFRTVILKYCFYIRHLGDENDIQYKNQNADNAFHQVHQQNAVGQMGNL